MKLKENVKTALIIALVLSNFIFTWYIAVNVLDILKENSIQIDGISKYLCEERRESNDDCIYELFKRQKEKQNGN